MEFLCLLNLAHGRYKKHGGYVKNPSREKLYIRGHWPVCQHLFGTYITIVTSYF
jgi:hypothetical protein